MKFRYRLIFFLIGIAGIAIMIIQADPKNIDWPVLLSTKMICLFCVLILLWLFIYAVHTFSYQIILKKAGANVPFFSLMRICISGFALNDVTPIGLVGGEPYRIMELKRHCSTSKATSSTLTFTLFYVAGHIMLWLTATIIYLCLGLPGETAISILMIGTLAVCSTFMILFILSKNRGFVLPFIKFLAKIPLAKKYFSKLLETKKEQFEEIDKNIIEFRSNSKKFWSVLLCQYFARILEGVEYYLILRFLMPNVSIFSGIIVMGCASLIGNLIFLIPMQAGSRESGMAIALGFLNIQKSYGVIVGLIYRLRSFLFVLIGIFLILIQKRTKKKDAECKELISEIIIGETSKSEDNTDCDILNEQNVNDEKNNQTENIKNDELSII